MHGPIHLVYLLFCHFRRKKKCIRLQINQHQALRNRTLLHQEQRDARPPRTPPILDPNPSINELRRLIPTIGMDTAPRLPPTSSNNDSNSETSIRSPSGLSSLPSLGSPSSMASPLGFNSALDSQDWFGKGSQPPSQVPSAFKPFAFKTVGKPRVGADPRDSKNPLSVSQMTGNPSTKPSATSSSSELFDLSPFHPNNERTILAWFYYIEVTTTA